jgi:hypothetical protein
VLAYFRCDSTYQLGCGSVYITALLTLEELAAIDSEHRLVGCRDAFRGGLVGALIAALIVSCVALGEPEHGPGGAAFLPGGRTFVFVFGLLVYGPFGFVVGLIIGAVIPLLRMQTGGTRKSVADELGPEINRNHSESLE